MPIKLENVHPDCRAFVATVEELLARRRRELLQRSSAGPAWLESDWGPRAWNRTELEDTVYSSYKQMRQGRITRPPRREIVMELADYLHCTLYERNRLLIAAHATPVSPYLNGERLAEVLPVAIAVASEIAIPALVINRDWNVYFQNEPLHRLFAIEPEQVAAIPAERRNVLHLLFDPTLPLYPQLIDNRESWVRMVRQTIYGFKMANLLCQFEPWYQALVNQLMALPEFAEHWHTVRVDAAFDDDPSAQAQPPTVTLAVNASRAPHGPRAWLRPLLISVGYFQFDFPLLLGFLPAEERPSTAAGAHASAQQRGI